jgi:hypothetical protein
MKRLGMIIAITSVFAVSAFGQGPRALNGGDVVADRPLPQLQKGIIELYLANFRNEVGLSDDQFLRVSPLVTRFVNARFQNANQRRMLEERQTELLSQPNPAEADIQKLNEDLARLEEGGVIDKRLIKNLQPELTPRQSLLASEFHRQFITERLPMLLERLRAAQANNPKAQERQANRANQQQNRKGQPQADRPANTLRDNNKAQPAPTRRK